MVRVGVIGYGYAGQFFHCPLIARVEGLHLYAVVSRDEGKRKRAKEQWGVKVYPFPEDLFTDPAVDLVVIATPHDTHYALTKAALGAGKHVVVDKPFTLMTEEADELIAEARRQGRLLSVFHNRRWDWDFLTVRAVIEKGFLGDVWAIESCIGRYGPPGRWRAERARMGSALHDWGVHLIDQALLLMGQPKQVMAWRHFRVWDLTVESHFRAVLDYGDGRTFTIEVSYLRGAERPRWFILGDRGGLVKFGLDPQEEALRRGDIARASEPPEHWARIWTHWNGRKMEMTLESVRGDWRDYYRNIAAVLNEGAELAVKPEEAREAVRVIGAALEAAKTGMPVPL